MERALNLVTIVDILNRHSQNKIQLIRNQYKERLFDIYFKDKIK